VDFIVDGRRVVMGPGECWYNNFNLPHSVTNRGTRDRIHLTIDLGVTGWFAELMQRASDPLQGGGVRG
jgi:hypothetical protein